MNSRILIGCGLAGGVLYLVHSMSPVSPSAVALTLDSPPSQAEVAARLTKEIADLNPLVEADELVPCTDPFDRPGLIVGRFCRDFETQSVNLRITNAIPMNTLRQFPNLKEIEAGGSRWDSLDPLLEFSDLTLLGLDDTEIGDPTALSELTNLEQLRLNGSNITNLDLVSGLTKLKRLSLKDLPVADLSALSGLNELEELDLIGSEITDLSPLAGLQNLKLLYLQNSKVTDVTPVSGIEGLTIRR